MSRCTGPYTRIPFAKSDQRAVMNFLSRLPRNLVDVEVTAQPSGRGTTDDFNLDLILKDALDPTHVWIVRLAKFMGPKRWFGHINVFELALSKRDADNAVLWSGALYASNLGRLGNRFPKDLPKILAGKFPEDLVPGEQTEAKRIQLCTGQS